MTVALFPGQGIPAKVVLEALPKGDRLLALANEILDVDLRSMVEAALRSSSGRLQTQVAQPAIFLAALISLREHVRQGIRFRYFVGHSLGEYPALTAARAFSLEDGLRAVAVRADSMHKAAIAAPGGMVALIGLERECVDEIAADAGVNLANDNSPKQAVVAGDRAALDLVGSLARARGGRAVRLPVEAAFHTEAMASAGESLAVFLNGIAVRSPVIPVISNVTANPYRAPGEIRRLLVAQLSQPVRFRESVEGVWDRGGRVFVDVGPGSILGPLAGQTIDPLMDRQSVLNA